jgi:hypothetical protein
MKVYLVKLRTQWRGASLSVLGITASIEVGKQLSDKRHQHDTRDGGRWCKHCSTPWVETTIGASKSYSDDDVWHEYTISEQLVLEAVAA